jgi:hypothetical protein
MAATPRLGLPYLNVGQAQKEFTHNEALQTLDALVAGAVEEPPRASPPAAPAIGACYIIADGATDAWAGMSQSVAAWTSGGWRFMPAMEGMSLYERTSGTWMAFRNGAWESGIVRGSALFIGGQQVVGSRAAAIESPAGGATIDAEGRTAIDAILGALRQHGLIDT